MTRYENTRYRTLHHMISAICPRPVGVLYIMQPQSNAAKKDADTQVAMPWVNLDLPSQFHKRTSLASAERCQSEYS